MYTKQNKTKKYLAQHSDTKYEIKSCHFVYEIVASYRLSRKSKRIISADLVCYVYVCVYLHELAFMCKTCAKFEKTKIKTYINILNICNACEVLFCRCRQLGHLNYVIITRKGEV